MRPPQDWRRAPVTLSIAGVTLAAWLLVALAGQDQAAAVHGGFIPGRIGMAGDPLPLPVWLTPLTATLVHAGLLHIAFNLLMHLFCGRAVEAIVGSRSFLLLYVIGAYTAAAAQYAVGPHVLVPMVGASGAISAVIGAYAALLGRNRVKVANRGLAILLHILWLAAAWVGIQLLLGLTFQPGDMRIAVAAHIGGFVAGAVLAWPLFLLRWRGA